MNIKKITLPGLWYFFLASVFLYFSQLLVLFAPFRWYIPLFRDSKNRKYELVTDEKLLVVRIALLRGLKYLPWKGKCLVQALSGKLLLRIFGMPGTIYLGVMKKDGNMKAHAWLISGNTFISGKDVHSKYTVVQQIS